MEMSMFGTLMRLLRDRRAKISGGNAVQDKIDAKQESNIEKKYTLIYRSEQKEILDNAILTLQYRIQSQIIHHIPTLNYKLENNTTYLIFLF